MGIAYRLPDYEKNIDKARQVEDCVFDRVKEAGDDYLPRPNPTDVSIENKRRYKQYLQRAVFMNVVKRTHDGLVGAVFRKDPEISLPSQLEYMADDCDGAGLGVTQTAKRGLSNTMTGGWGGFLADFPEPSEDTTLAATEERKARIIPYKFEDIINWRVEDGRLVMVVLKETFEFSEDGFEYEYADQYRELRIEEGRYIQRIWIDDEVQEWIEPTKFDGSAWAEIPFSFSGTINNNALIDPSLLYSLSEINLAHYRNSADLEENCHIHGQMTLGVTSDMDLEQWKSANPSGVLVGARAGHFLGGQGSFVTAQAQPNQLADKLMERKEQQMLSIGAKLIEQGSGNETAEGVRERSGAGTANLSTLAKNVSDAMRKALRYAAEFMGADPDAIEFQLNQKFYPDSMDAQEAAALIQLYDRGRIGAVDLHRKLQSAGWIGEDRELEDIDGEPRSPFLG